MKKKNLLLPLTTIALALTMGLAACTGGQGGSQGGESQAESQQSQGQQEKITIQAADGKTTLLLGQTVQLTASVEGVTWSSKKEDVATVSASGLVTAVGEGSTTITASKDGMTSGTISIKVQLEPITISAAGDKKFIEIDQTLQLTADKDGVTWASSDQTIATVSATGLVTALKAGTVNITASKDKFKAGTYSLTVTRPAALINIHWEDADHYSPDGWWGTADDGYTPVYARSDGNASDATCIAHLVDGDKETIKFSSDKAIKAELVATMASSSGIEDLSTVMVAKFNDAELSLAGVGATSGSNSQFDEVSLGEVNLKVGENVLELSFIGSGPYLDDLRIHSKETATITFTKAPAKEQIEAKATSMTAYIGEETEIELTKPTDKAGLRYVSDKETVATVDENGKVKGLDLGTANITIVKDGMLATRIEVVVEKKVLQGEIRVEAEAQADDFDWSSLGFHKYTDRTQGITAGHSGSAYITGYDVNAACDLTYEFESDKAQTMTLIIAGASHYQMAEDYVFGVDCTLTLNGQEITCAADAKIVSDQRMGAPTVEVTIGTVNVKAGTNTFVIHFNERAPALDCFRFMPVA